MEINKGNNIKENKEIIVKGVERRYKKKRYLSVQKFSRLASYKKVSKHLSRYSQKIKAPPASNMAVSEKYFGYQKNYCKHWSNSTPT